MKTCLKLWVVNAQTSHVGAGPDFSDFPTTQDLASRNVPTRLLTGNNFQLARDPGTITELRPCRRSSLDQRRIVCAFPPVVETRYSKEY